MRMPPRKLGWLPWEIKVHVFLDHGGWRVGVTLTVITSFIIRYLSWQAGIRSFAPDSDYPLTGLLLRQRSVDHLLDRSRATQDDRCCLWHRNKVCSHAVHRRWRPFRSTG